MKKIKFILISLLIMTIILPKIIFAQPNIPKELIPPNTSTEVREQIERLYSANAVERARGAFRLGNMGEEALPAIPFLLGIEDEKSPPLEWRSVTPVTASDRDLGYIERSFRV